MARFMRAALIFVTACSSATDVSDVTITVDPNVVTMVGRHVPLALGEEVFCDYQITVRATGSGDATWVSAQRQFLTATGNLTRAVPVSDLISEFGSSQITSGTSRTAAQSEWQFQPFTVITIFRYRSPTGEVRTASHTLNCQ